MFGIKTTFLIIIGFILGCFAMIIFIAFTLSSFNENTVTFQTDSEWFSECVGPDYGDFILIFGTMNCEDIGLEKMRLQDKND